MKKGKYIGCIVLVNVILVCIWLVGKRFTKTTTNYDINITMESTVSTDVVDEVKNAITYFPKSVVQSFTDNDWKFVLLKDFEDDERYEHLGSVSTIVGLINFSDKVITIRGSAEYENAARDIAIHELCHYADRIWGNKSSSDKATALYEKYKNGKFITFAYAGIPFAEEYREDMLYATSDKYEFFAETMKDYLLHPKYLKDNYPDIYNFHRELIKK